MNRSRHGAKRLLERIEKSRQDPRKCQFSCGHPEQSRGIFWSLLDKKYTQERKSINLPILFRMLILQQLLRLSHEEIKSQANDKPSFDKFLGLGMMNRISGPTPSPSSEKDFKRQISSKSSLRHLKKFRLCLDRPARPAAASGVDGVEARSELIFRGALMSAKNLFFEVPLNKNY